jgi:hypothetical protein
VTMTSLPTQVAELDYADLADTPDWHSIAADLDGWSVSGPSRQKVTQRFSNGTATVTLDNSSGDYTAGNAAGAHHPLRPNMRIRLGWTWTDDIEGTVTRWEFTGLVDGWPREYQSRNDDTVILTATDLSKNLQRQEIRSAHEIEMAAVDLSTWFRLGESSGTVAFDSAGDGRHGTFEGGASFYSRSGLIANDADGAIELDGVNRYVRLPLEAAITGTGAVTFGAWFSTQGDTNTVYLYVQGTDRDVVATSAVLSYSPDIGLVVFKTQLAGGASIQSADAVVAGLNDGNRHMVVGTRSAAGTTMNLYVDGVLVDTSVVTAQSLGAATGSIGSPDHLPPAGSAAEAVTIDEVFSAATELDAATVAALYDAGATPWEGDLPGARADRVLDAAGVPAGDRDLDPGRSSMSAANFSRRSPWDALADCGDAEGIGAVYVDGDGKVVLVDRDTIWTSSRWTTSQATFGPSDVLYTKPLRVDHNEGEIATRTVTGRVGGSRIVKNDASAQAQYGIIEIQKTGMPVTDDDVAEGLADYLLAELAAPADTVPTLTIAPGDSIATWTQAVERRIGDRITIAPPDGTASVVATISGKSWSVAGRKVRVTFTLHRPLSPVFIWDSSTWDTTTRWGF